VTFDPNSLLGGYTQAELEAAFALVAPKDNWKLPINAKLPGKTTPREIDKIAFAIGFFTGGVATFTFDGISYAVTAPGYYAAVGA
jgi:hypothetical protein